MSATGDGAVLDGGQIRLPAELCHRWGIDGGGEVGFIDLGDAALVVPGGLVVGRREVRRVLRERYELAVADIGDQELADQ